MTKFFVFGIFILCAFTVQAQGQLSFIQQVRHAVKEVRFGKQDSQIPAALEAVRVQLRHKFTEQGQPEALRINQLELNALMDLYDAAQTKRHKGLSAQADLPLIQYLPILVESAVLDNSDFQAELISRYFKRANKIGGGNLLLDPHARAIDVVTTLLLAQKIDTKLAAPVVKTLLRIQSESGLDAEAFAPQKAFLLAQLKEKFSRAKLCENALKSGDATNQ